MDQKSSCDYQLKTHSKIQEEASKIFNSLTSW